MTLRVISVLRSYAGLRFKRQDKVPQHKFCPKNSKLPDMLSSRRSRFFPVLNSLKKMQHITELTSDI